MKNAGFTTRTRFISFTRADLNAYGDVLSDAFPEVRFRTPLEQKERMAAEPPSIALHRRLADCPANPWGDMSLSIFLGDTSALHIPYKSRPITSWLEPGSLPCAHLQFPRAPANTRRKHFQALPALIESAQLSFVASGDDPAEVKTIEKAIRLLRKVAWRGLVDFHLIDCSDPAAPLITLKESGCRVPEIFGRDAVRWAGDDPQRLLGVLPNNPRTRGYRPLAGDAK
jgi:hypothetical protein